MRIKLIVETSVEDGVDPAAIAEFVEKTLKGSTDEEFKVRALSDAE